MSQSIAFTLLHNAFNSGFASPSEFVIQDPDEFTRRWRGVLQGTPDTAQPVVDFANTSVVLVAIGSRNTGGYSVHVDSVASAAGVTTVHYTVTSPGARCMSLQTLTAPVEVISVERVQGAVRFSKRSVSRGC
ncbi:MAG: protease complex subunit PrcB family protein [Phycisphaerae bacterium]|nr:protease complex subunit PrcB family protein [Gemmatimonadaceae bacterium]